MRCRRHVPAKAGGLVTAVRGKLTEGNVFAPIAIEWRVCARLLEMIEILSNIPPLSGNHKLCPRPVPSDVLPAVVLIVLFCQNAKENIRHLRSTRLIYLHRIIREEELYNTNFVLFRPPGAIFDFIGVLFAVETGRLPGAPRAVGACGFVASAYC